jgi:hypothetical protein
MFEGRCAVFAGPMVAVLGTSLQNEDLLKFFHESGNYRTGNGGSYYQKRFNRSKIRRSVPHDIKVRYAYYTLIIHLKPGSSIRWFRNTGCKTYI